MVFAQSLILYPFPAAILQGYLAVWQAVYKTDPLRFHWQHLPASGLGQILYGISHAGKEPSFSMAHSRLE